MLTENQKQQYHRQILLPEIGIDGQQKLLNASVLIIGLGGLGCPVAQYLVATGVGKFGLADFDVIDFTNLHRQIFYTNDDVGKQKVAIAKTRMLQMNPNLIIETFSEKLDNQKILQVIEPYDIVLDCTDNFSTRYCVNDACFLMNKPLVFGAVNQFVGQVAVFNVEKEGKKTNYRDLFPKQPSESEVENCSELGVLGLTCSVIGSFQALEAIKFIVESENIFANKILTYNVLNHRSYCMDIQKNPDAALHQPKNQKDFLQHTYQSHCNLNEKYEIKIEQLINQLDSEKIQWIDIRELNEIPTNPLQNIKKMPLSSLKIEDINPTFEQTIIICQSGKRSFNFVKTHQSSTKTKLISLFGGINLLQSYFDANKR